MTRWGQRLWHWRTGVIAAAAVLALPGLWVDTRVFIASWFVAWWFCLGLVLGAQVNAWIQRLTGGRWGLAVQPVAAWTSRRLQWLLLLFLPVATGAPLLYPWAAVDVPWAQSLAQPAFVLAWFAPGFIWARLLVYAAAWWALSRTVWFAGRGGAAASLALHLVLGSLASVDLLMSLTPGWYSTAFGLIVLSGQALGATALSALALVLAAPGFAPPARRGTVPLWRDLGNLLLMWVMTWAYVAFMQFLIIWAENLPRETSWYLPRLQTGWSWVAVGLVLLLFAVPLLALLWRAVKDRPQRLAAVAVLALVMQLVNTAWLVLPSVSPHSALGWWLVPLMALAFGLFTFGAPLRPTLEATHADR